MAIKRLGAQRFSGLDADVPSLPIDADLIGAIFDSTDTLKFWIFNGTVWNESAGGGGITGLNPNSTILDHSTDIADYTSPATASATSEDGANVAANAVDGSTATFWKSNAGINESLTIDMGSVLNDFALAFYIDKTQTGITETQFQIKTIDASAPSFVNDFSVDNMTHADATATNISSNRFNVNVVGDASDDSSWWTIGSTLSDTNWVMRYEWVTTETSGSPNPNASGLFVLSSVNATETTAKDFIGIRWIISDSGFSYTLIGGDNTATDSPQDFDTFDTAATGADNYFIEISRNGATVTGKLFANSDFTGQVGTDASITITGTIIGLQYWGYNHRHATSGNTGTAQVHNLNIWNNTSVVPPATTPVILRTINVSDLVDQQYNFIRFNGLNTQFLSIEGSSGSSLVMAANDLQILVEAEPPLITAHGQFEINGTNENLALDGGNPTSSVIDDPSTNSMTLVSAVEQNDPPTDGMVMWNEILDSNNSVSHSKMKIDGAIKNVRWF